MKAGIDLGTSYSSICIINHEGKAEPVYVKTDISVFGDNYSLPSAVYIDHGNIIVGQAAINSRMKNPENFKSEFKRDLGQDIPYYLDNRQLLPQDLYREVFSHLKQCAESYAGESIELACITHPANYNDRKKELVKTAAKKAGILNVELIDEPTAAALHYFSGKNISEGNRLLVYDFGGGTFDAALIEYKKGRFDSITPSLGVECGGIDIDRVIFDDLSKTFDIGKNEGLKLTPLNLKRFKAKLIEMSVKAKHHLSSAENFTEDIEVHLDFIPYLLNRDHFNIMISGFIDQTISCVNLIVQNAGMKLNEINTVLLVGGTSRIPLVRERLRQSSDKNLHVDVNPEMAVSMGAALWAKQQGNKKTAAKPCFCIYCGLKHSTADRYCIRCGKKNESYIG